MDQPHLLAAFRYLALKPVKARLAAAPADWPWSSRSAHLRRQNDGLVPVRPLLERVENVAQFLDRPEDPERVAALTGGQTVGRPLMGEHALAELEKRLGRTLRPGKPGRRPSSKNDPDQLELV